MRKLTIITLLFFAALSCAAQGSAVMLATIYPGKDVWNVYGHTMIIVQRPGSFTAYNYGVFDFNEPNFVYRFLRGDANYCIEAMPGEYALTNPKGRKTVVQVFDLTEAQVDEVEAFLNWNIRPENRNYKYNFARDNCSTRVRDIILKAAGDSLSINLEPQHVTYRDLFDHYNANYAWQKFGINLILGPGIDYELSLDEEMFLPMVMMRAFDKAEITRNGEKVPFVVNRLVTQEGREEGNIDEPTPLWMTPEVVFFVLLLLTLWFSAKRYKGKFMVNFMRAFDFVLFLAFALAGCIVAFLVFFSNHYATSPNINLLVFNPLMAVIAVLSVLPGKERALRRAHLVFIAACALWGICQLFGVQTVPIAADILILTPLARSCVKAARRNS